MKTRTMVACFLFFCCLMVNFSTTQIINASDDELITLTLVGTGDVAQAVLPYNYDADEWVQDFGGMSKIYSVVEMIREQQDHVLLFDTGDTLQGQIIDEVENRIHPLQEGDVPIIIQVMNKMGFDAAGVGNHEVQDFGLNYFDLAVEGSDFPWIAANMYHHDSDQHYVEPYTILEKEVNGKTLKVGVLAFVPPRIMVWGRTHLEGKVNTVEIIESAREFIPKVADKSDILVLATHTGVDVAQEDEATCYNAGYVLAKFEEVDAMFFGHDGSFFPSEEYYSLPGIDLEASTIHGTPTVSGDLWGSRIGRIDLDLAYNEGDWEVVSHQVENIRIDQDVKSHSAIEELAWETHEKTLEYIRTPIGDSLYPITSFFAEIKDSSAMQLINNAQIWYGEKEITGTKYEDHTVISHAAPFLTDIFFGNGVTINNTSELYIFPNEVYFLELDGEQLKDYLERAAKYFPTIDPNDLEPQYIQGTEPSFNWDVIEGVEYLIDITQPPGERIVSLSLDGKPITSDDLFVMVSNDYRAGGGGDYPHTGEEASTILDRDYRMDNRGVIIEYIQEFENIDPKPTHNWSLMPIETVGPIYYLASPGAEKYLEEDDILWIEFIDYDEEGNPRFKLDMKNIGITLDAIE